MAGYSSFLKEDKETVCLQLFAKLKLRDLIKCREVCVSWRKMIDENIRYKNLIVHRDVYPCARWSFDNSPLNSSESVRVFRLASFFSSSLVNSIFKNIQKLLLYCAFKERGFYELDSLNNFSELRELEIFGFCFDSRKEYKLKLEKLRFLFKK